MPSLYDVAISGVYLAENERDALAQFLLEHDHLFVNSEDAESYVNRLDILPSSFWTEDEWAAIEGDENA